MSYEFRFTSKARRRFRALSIEFQEAVLDLLEALVADIGGGGTAEVHLSEQHVLHLRTEDQVAEIHVDVDTDRSAEVLTVVSIWYVAQLK